MKTHITYLFFLLFAVSAHAQLADGTTAPDWTATDLNSMVHDMSDMLDDGKHVVLEFSATWCGPCWNFHNTGTMETLYDTYGPDGTDEIRVFYIEADQGTTEPCLYGESDCVGGTIGDWVTGHDFPFIDITATNAPSMPGDYSVAYYPTVYIVSANHTNGVYEIGQQTNIDVWETWFYNSFEMEVSETVVNADCGGPTGSISLDVTDGEGAITAAWSNGMTGLSIDGLEPGTYDVTVTDANGYFLEYSYEVTGVPAPSVDAEQDSDVSCFGADDGVLQVIATGGNGGFTYEWSNGATGPMIDNLSPDTYTVVATDAIGCETEETYVIEEPEALSNELDVSDSDCIDNQGTVVVSSTGGTAPYTYTVGSQSNMSGVFNLDAGGHTVQIVDANGCDESQSFDIAEAEEMIAMAQSDGTVITCAVTEANVSGAGSTEGPNVSYEWVTTDGNIVSGATSLEAVVNVGGTYTLIVYDVITTCTDMMSVTVSEDLEFPSVDVEQPGEIGCDVASLDIDGSGSDQGDNITYVWTTEDGNIIDGADEAVVSVDQGGAYTLTVINDGSGCSVSETVIVEQDDEVPTIDVDDAVIGCSETEITLCATVSDGATVVWETPSGPETGECIQVSMAGDYTATATGSNGCEREASASVEENTEVPQVSIAEPAPITCIDLNSVISADVEGDEADFTVVWTTEDGNIVGGNDAAEVTVDAAGTYTVTVVNLSSGCETIMTVDVAEEREDPISSFSYEVVDGVIIVTSTSEGNPTELTWNDGQQGEEVMITYDENGTYQICLTASNDCGMDEDCQDVAFATELLFETAFDEVLCFEDIGRLEVEPSGGQPEYAISWTGPNGFSSDEFVIDNLEAGEYTMMLTDEFGYVKTESYLVAEATEITASDAEIEDASQGASDGSVMIDIEGGTGDLRFLWSNGATTEDLIDVPGGDYFVSVRDDNDCEMIFGPYKVGLSSAVADLTIVTDFQLSPVPASTDLTVRIQLQQAVDSRVSIINSAGVIQYQEDFYTNVINRTIDVSSMSAGMYFLEFGTATDRQVEKFVIVK